MRTVSKMIIAVLFTFTFSSYLFAQGDRMMNKEMKGGMMEKDSMMSHMCGMMGFMMGKTMIVTPDGDIVLLNGNKLQKYDKDLNLIKEIEIQIDMKSMQKMMEQCRMMHQQGGASSNSNQ